MPNEDSDPDRQTPEESGALDRFLDGFLRATSDQLSRTPASNPPDQSLQSRIDEEKGAELADARAYRKRIVTFTVGPAGIKCDHCLLHVGRGRVHWHSVRHQSVPVPELWSARARRRPSVTLSALNAVTSWRVTSSKPQPKVTSAVALASSVPSACVRTADTDPSRRPIRSGRVVTVRSPASTGGDRKKLTAKSVTK